MVWGILQLIPGDLGHQTEDTVEGCQIIEGQNCVHSHTHSEQFRDSNLPTVLNYLEETLEAEGEHVNFLHAGWDQTLIPGGARQTC